jgi:hypothetical protein
MICRAWQQLLQQHLDGDEGADLEQHLQACPHCAAERPALRRLLDGLALLAPAVPPGGLAERITSRLCAEAGQQRRRQRQRRLIPVWALAAAALVLVALGIRMRWPAAALPQTNDPGASAVVKTPDRPPAPAPLLRDSMAQAGTALASLTRRTANETVDQTASLLPLLPAPAVEPFSPGPALETPLEPLREASAGVSDGLAPVADHARRAVSLFFRDLPMGRTEPAKPSKPAPSGAAAPASGAS